MYLILMLFGEKSQATHEKPESYLRFSFRGSEMHNFEVGVPAYTWLALIYSTEGLFGYLPDYMA